MPCPAEPEPLDARLRGLPRPPDDKYADRLAQSDPVYAVWGERGGA